MLQNIDHINIVVADLQKMVAFYRDVLGMKVTKEVSIRGKWVERVVGLAPIVAHVVYLELESGPRVELIQYESPRGKRADGLDAANTRGLRHIAFRVDDIEKTAAHLEARGVALLSRIETVPDTQVTYAGGVRKRLVYFRDPEENLLELCEYGGGGPRDEG